MITAQHKMYQPKITVQHKPQHDDHGTAPAAVATDYRSTAPTAANNTQITLQEGVAMIWYAHKSMHCTTSRVDAMHGFKSLTVMH
jgi:hypothetical protein